MWFCGAVHTRPRWEAVLPYGSVLKMAAFEGSEGYELRSTSHS